MRQAIGMAKSIWFVALLALGCSEEPRRFSLAGFNDGETSVIQDAAAEWCATGAYCPNVAGGDNEIVLTSTLPVAGRTIHTSDLTADGETRILLLDRRQNSGWLQLLHINVLHELGHAGGCLEHIPGAAMSADESDSPGHLTQADIDCAR